MGRDVKWVDNGWDTMKTRGEVEVSLSNGFLTLCWGVQQ